jgi:hypothetical protein
MERMVRPAEFGRIAAAYHACPNWRQHAAKIAAIMVDNTVLKRRRGRSERHVSSIFAGLPCSVTEIPCSVAHIPCLPKETSLFRRAGIATDAAQLSKAI